ncbi:MAG: phage tail protein [Acidimicrobiia bacterium]|nr:phage tail protein [Acidimicrobiia bacterium]
MAEHDAEHLGSQFALELDGVELARFTGCSGLTVNTEVVEYQDTLASGRVVTRKRPGRTSYDDIVLKRGLSGSKSLTDWHQKVLDGKVERQNGSIVVYDSAGTEVDRWNFEAGWPSVWSASDLDAGSDDVMIEELTIAHELLKRA